MCYKESNDSSYKRNKEKRDHKERKKIARKGKSKQCRYFNSKIGADYRLAKTIGYKAKNKFIWNR